MTKKKTYDNLLVGILVGITFGAMLGGFSPEMGKEVKFIGELFIRSLLMLVVPLVMASMIVGISGLGDIRHLGGIGGKTVLYYMLTTAMSVIIGIAMVNLIQPGRAASERERIALRGGELISAEYKVDEKKLILDSGKFGKTYDERYMAILTDQGNIRGVLKKTHDVSKQLSVVAWTDAHGKPAMPRICGSGIQIDLAVAERVKGKKSSISDILRDVIVGLVPKNLFASMANNEVLPLIVFSLVFGAVLTTLGEKGRAVIAVFEGINDAIMHIVHLLMIAAPFGIGALIAGRLGDAGGFAGFMPQLLRLSSYVITVCLGLFIHAVFVLPSILHFLAKRDVKSYLANVGSALVTAFSTASSSATLPLTMECTIEKNGISERVASFVLPLGATINMDGTALYEAVSAVFIAQLYGIHLGFGHMLVIFLTATLAAVGAAGIPEAGLVTMVIVLQAVKLPVEGISLILVIDWLLDRFRTTVNVWGDAVGAAVVESME